VALPELRCALFVGEALTQRDVDRLRALAPQAQLVNLYGATETQQALAHHPLPAAGEPLGVVPLGRGIDGVELVVLGAGGRPAGIGELGEIYVRSRYLAAGYLEPDGEDGRFATNPFTGEDGDRVYRTGDLGRYRCDGAVVFAGRRDQQVQIRGFRVEPAEIETALAATGGVREAAVVVRHQQGEARLAAAVAPQPGVRLAADGLRAALGRRLPPYMVPASFLVVDALPRLASGKIDRRAVAGLVEQHQEVDVAYRAPRTEMERTLVALLREVLGAERVGVDDNFFELGGNSLTLVELQGRLERILGRQIAPVEIFNHPTARLLAEHLSAGSEPAVPAASGEDRGAALRRGRDRLRQRRRASRSPTMNPPPAEDEERGE
ncbi:MAG: non-ribosomal peptide synthetase, partial [Acidobacteria bacterium]